MIFVSVNANGILSNNNIIFNFLTIFGIACCIFMYNPIYGGKTRKYLYSYGKE